MRRKKKTMLRLAATHPGEMLREEFLVPMGLSANALALAIRVPVTRVSEIVNERRGITADTALRLARYFRMTPEFWMNLQSHYDLEIAREANDVLSDDKKRKVYDQFGFYSDNIDPAAAEAAARGGYAGGGFPGGGAGEYRSRGGAQEVPFDFGGFDFSDFTSGGGRQQESGGGFGGSFRDIFSG